MVINRQEILLESHAHNFLWDFLNIHNKVTNVSNGNRTVYKKVFKEAKNIKASFIVDLDICC